MYVGRATKWRVDYLSMKVAVIGPSQYYQNKCRFTLQILEVNDPVHSKYWPSHHDPELHILRRFGQSIPIFQITQTEDRIIYTRSITGDAKIILYNLSQRLFEIWAFCSDLQELKLTLSACQQYGSQKLLRLPVPRGTSFGCGMFRGYPGTRHAISWFSWPHFRAALQHALRAQHTR